jgi:hypothetical protein
VSTQTPPAQGQEPPQSLTETHAGRPVDPAVFQRRTSPSRVAPILVGAVAVLLLGGAGAAWVIMGRRAQSDAQAASSASVGAATAPSAAPSDTPSAAPTETATTAQATTETPSTTSSATPSDSASAAAATAPDSTLACDPDCDEIRVDDKTIELGKPVALAPGKHVVVASKNGYVTIKETVTVTAGEKLERTFKMKLVPAAGTAQAAPPGTGKPCGKFLKRGAGCK